MAVDLAFLASNARIERSALGIAETLVRARIGSDDTVAVLYEPLGQPKPECWVICHSFGQEQSHLMEHEVAGARALASAGFPVLRYHGQGYGDSAGDYRAITLESHIADAIDAVELVRDRTGIQRAGVLGARFGGMVAALVADRARLPLLAMWEPVVQGSSCIREILRNQVLSDLARDDDEPAEAPPLKTNAIEELNAQGWADVNGLYVSKEAYDQISAASLDRDLQAFDGDALIVGLARSGSPSPKLARLAERIRGLGARCEEQVVIDDQARALGQYHYLGPVFYKVDSQFAMERALAAATVGWCLRRAEASGGGAS